LIRQALVIQALAQRAKVAPVPEAEGARAVNAAEQSSGEWPLWRPLLFTRVAMPCVVVPSVVYFLVKLVAGLIRDPSMGSLGALMLLFLLVGSLGLAIGAVSVPWVKAQIVGDRLVFVNRFWSDQEIPLSSISAVQPGERGLDVTRIDGTVVSVHAITNYSGKSERAAAIAEQIQAAAAAVPEDR